MSDRSSGFTTVARATVAVLAAGVSGWMVARGVLALSDRPMGPWLLARAGGLTSYLLLVALVATGLLLAHPRLARMRRPDATTRLRLHVGLAVGTLVFTVLHVVALAVDEHAGVGWQGALLPLASTYRPVPVTLGVIGLYAGVAAALTASAAGGLAARVWWPVHKVAAVSLVLVWVHSVLAGSDTPALLVLYLATGAAVLLLAVSRYVARTTADEVAERARRAQPVTSDLHVVPQVSASQRRHAS